MLLRRYGSRIQSVEPNFVSTAMTEIGFIRGGDFTAPADDFLEEYERVGEHSITAQASGDVKLEAEQAMLDSVRAQLDGIMAEEPDEAMLLVENGPGGDHPKPRDNTTREVITAKNRLHFEYTLDPPLRIGVYRKKDS